VYANPLLCNHLHFTLC